MITSEKEYLEAMRNMIRKVQNGYEPPFNADEEELEIFAECIKRGYLKGITTYIDVDGHERELRTMDGKMHAELSNHTVSPEGLAFLNPDKTDLKSNIAIGVSIFAALVSLLAFLTSLLSNLDKIIDNWKLLTSLFS